ncbi:hypothetical protein [Cyclobacterium plantarum]|uniref:hypothetical protein n=1 Tax=Cyclobacterium plantarum TaxID=2716263 RepID=UPI003F700F87
MIRFTFILVAGFLAFNISNAQSLQDLKGPAAKNYKPWKEQARKGTLMVKVDDKKVKGPAFKNKKRFKGDFEVFKVDAQLAKRERITGPKAKNRKPWKKD